MKDYSNDLIQLIDNKYVEWKNYDVISYTNGLDETEYARRLEKIIQYPISLNTDSYVKSIVGTIDKVYHVPPMKLDILQLKEVYLRPNETEHYMRQLVMSKIKDIKLVQFSRNVYTNTTGMKEVNLEPLVQLSNRNQTIDDSVRTVEPLNHLVSDNKQDYYTFYPTDTNISTVEKIIHLIPDSEYNDTQQDIINSIESLSENQVSNVYLQPVYEEKEEELFEPTSVDESPVENITVPQTKTEKHGEEVISKIKDKKLIERLKEQVLNASKSEDPTIRIPSGATLKPLDHWRGRVYESDTHTMRPVLQEYDAQHDAWNNINEDAPVKGVRRRVYDYYNPAMKQLRGDDYKRDYEYENTAPSAGRTITGAENQYHPKYRGSIDDQFDSADNQFRNKDGSLSDEGKLQQDGLAKFQGMRTSLYLENEKDKKDIQSKLDGLLIKERERFNQSKTDGDSDKGNYPERPLTVLDPFMRVSTHGKDLMFIPQHANAFAYNRTRLPIAEIEWRKGFRYLFITRPECYIMTSGNVLSSQCMNDETFYTSWCRLPHISYLLSPNYVTCTDKHNFSYKDNFNYLLTNRVMNMSVTGTTLEQLQSVQKSTNNASIMPGTTISSDYGNTLNLTFRDTKDLEVYECLRLWMRYIHNIYIGTFASSYNNYSYYNNYGDLSYTGENTGSNVSYKSMNKIHPYDRALDYCSTIFDIVTNESGTKIVYWCKYIGVYPINVTQSGLTDNMNKALDNEQTLSASFYYQGKEEYKMKSLVEFNYNAGILNSLGKPESDTKWVVSNPYLVRQSTNPDKVGYVDPKILKMDYIGAAGMFTGRPYCVLREGYNRLMPTGLVRKTITPQLRFMPSQSKLINIYMNGGIVNEHNTKPSVLKITS
jgi:hypothetical protein